MYVKFLSGPREGEIVEMKFLDAKAVINDGRAELAYRPDAAVAEPAKPDSAPPAPIAADDQGEATQGRKNENQNTRKHKKPVRRAKR